jgi:type IV pilus assembly protein PilW
MTMSLSYRQRGLSMIELMVALLLSSFLILGVTQIYIDNKRTYIYQQGQGENQENSRFALMFLERQLAKAGYRRDPRSELPDTFPASPTLGCGFEEGQTVARVDATTICLRYQPRDKYETDCFGSQPFSASTALDAPYEALTTNSTIVEKISVSDGVLTCQASTSNSSDLIEGISGIYFDYGVNDSVYDRDISKYSAEPVTGEYVRSLRYSILFTATPNNLTEGMSNRVCGDEGDWKKATGIDFTCETGKLYQMVSGSSTLRNLMP